MEEPLIHERVEMEDLAAALAAHGLILRGGFHPDPGEAGLEAVETLLLVGNAGGAMWEAFAPHADGRRHALDRWTKSVIDAVAAPLGAHVLYPFGMPRWPFQQWALRADAVFSSPLGILIHPEYGLWHAYRAALAFRERMPLPPRGTAVSPCGTCVDRPCLGACPVGAFDGERYDVGACAGHLAARGASGGQAACHGVGCLARNACPVGAEWRYPAPQVRFHMAAFARSLADAAGSPG